VPIVSADRLYGVINVFLKEGHERNSQEETFLSAVADALAGAVERKRAEETLRSNAAKFLTAQFSRRAEPRDDVTAVVIKVH
jgi:GAF domain-containing protein